MFSLIDSFSAGLPAGLPADLLSVLLSVLAGAVAPAPCARAWPLAAATSAQDSNSAPPTRAQKPGTLPFNRSIGLSFRSGAGQANTRVSSTHHADPPQLMLRSSLPDCTSTTRASTWPA